MPRKKLRAYDFFNDDKYVVSWVQAPVQEISFHCFVTFRTKIAQYKERYEQEVMRQLPTEVSEMWICEGQTQSSSH